MSKCYHGYFEKMIANIVQECEKNRSMLAKIKFIIMTLSETNDKISLFNTFGKAIYDNASLYPSFSSDFVETLGHILTSEPELYDIRAKLADSGCEKSKDLFKVLYLALY